MGQPARVVVADDEANVRQVISAVLRRDGHDVVVCEDGQQAIEVMDAGSADVIVTDVVMRKVSGIEVLRRVQQTRPEIPVIMMTAFGTMKSAVDAIKLGAYDYLAKPFDMEELRTAVGGAVQEHRNRLARKPPEAADRPAPEQVGLPGLIGKGEWLKQVTALAVRVARSRANVLIRGESGTGKELVARGIHVNSDRAHAPFVAVACAALSADLLESELFGHEKGAFTGAIAQKPGRFELANGGTLFLDEIGDIDPSMQLKLLRVLQEREFERVGGTKTIHVDVRLVAATNGDLEAAVRAGAFREDLYYRLHVVQITLPPLHEREEDVPVLVRHFMDKYSRENGKNVMAVPRAVMKKLQRYPWPGNVRELENAIERAVVLAEPGGTRLEMGLLPPAVMSYTDEGQGDDRAGRRGGNRVHLVRNALHRFGGDPAKAAAALGMAVRSVEYYVRKYGLMRNAAARSGGNGKNGKNGRTGRKGLGGR